MNNSPQFETESGEMLSELGAEQLIGSGFENEDPDSGFTEPEVLIERAERE